MITVLAEKPSVARELAKVMGATNKKEGFIEGNGYFFTWAFGHLVELAPPTSYGYNPNGWSLEWLPMLPDPFKLVTRQLKGKDGYYDDPSAKKQLKVIRECFQGSDQIVVATDAGREGELIFRYIYLYLKIVRPFKRLWISSQTDIAIREGFKNLKNGNEYDRLYMSARLRSESDWLVGMNATQALSLTVGNKEVYSIGRVQTPTLVMICKRYLDNTKFTPEVYYELELVVEKNGNTIKATSDRRWQSEQEALVALDNVRKQSHALVKLVETKEKKEPVPLLYDLSTLQQEANVWFGYSADETLGYAQSLYESKYITYPRTGSRYIGEDVFQSVSVLIKQYSGNEAYSKTVEFLLAKPLNKRSVNDGKVTDHHALLPTENVPFSLGEKEQNIYNMIVERMLQAFHETAIKEVVNVTLDAVENFKVNGSSYKYEGWRSVVDRREEKGEDEGALLPNFELMEKLAVKALANVRKQTKAKPLHTEATLLKAMETCGQEIEDEEARESMKESGLGTPATRADTIEKLLKRKYIERKKKSLVPTQKGLAVYGLVKEKMIGKPELTGHWEKKLAMIGKGSLDGGSFAIQIKGYAKDVTNEFLGSAKAMQADVIEVSGDLPDCPKCKKSKVKHINNSKLYAWACGDKECGFILFGEIAGKKLSLGQANLLLTEGKTKQIKGFKSKTGRPFDAVLFLSEDHKVKFEFNN